MNQYINNYNLTVNEIELQSEIQFKHISVNIVHTLHARLNAIIIFFQLVSLCLQEILLSPVVTGSLAQHCNDLFELKPLHLFIPSFEYLI